ncbi:Crp/Fnr family transcriptional regulator [Roseibium aquae]|nr:Crp/Fnr family transcriptional regulator [Roseibium aquae]
MKIGTRAARRGTAIATHWVSLLFFILRNVSSRVCFRLYKHWQSGHLFRMIFGFNNYSPGVLNILSADAREALLAIGRRFSFSDGQLVQSRGHVALDLAIVLKGGLRMMTLGADGSALLTAVFGPGQQINEVTLFAKAARTHDVVAVGETELLTLTQTEYQRFSEQHPEIVHALLVSNVHRVHQLVEALNDLRALPKAVVLARVLLKNARHQRGTSSTNCVELGLTQDDVAMFLGVSRAYLNKVLGGLSELGLIKVSYRKIAVLDLTALETWIQDHLTYDPVELFEARDAPAGK